MDTDMAKLIIHVLIKQPGARTEQERRHRHGLREEKRLKERRTRS